MSMANMEENTEARVRGKSKPNILALVFGVIAFCLLIVVIVLIVVVVHEKDKQKHSDTHPSREVIRNELYVREAGRMMQWMNVSVNPCDDFYEYACGNFIKNTPIPPGQISMNFITRLNDEVWDDLKPLVSASVQRSDLESIKKVKWAYEACMDEVDIERLGPQPMMDLLNSLGGWPLLDPYWNERRVNLVHIMVDLAMMGIDGIVKFQVMANQTDSSKSSLQMLPPKIAMGPRLVSSDPADVAAVANYTALALKIAKLLDPNSRVTEQHINNSITEFVDLERQLAELTKQETSSYYDVPVSALMQSNVPLTSRPWPEFIGGYMNAGGATFDPNQAILIDPYYLENMTSVLQNSNKKTIVNLLLWNLVSKLSSQLSTELATESTKVLELSEPVVTDVPRWSTCVQLVDKYLKRATGRMYVDAYFDETTKQDVTTMASDLREAFKMIIQDTTWMDATTRTLAEEKLAAIKVVVGYSPEIMNDTYLHDDYGTVQITYTTHFTNVVNLRKNDVSLPLKNFANGQDRDEWIGQTTVVNAAYVPSKNHVEINAAILNPYVYDIKFPKFVNYGGLGSVLGHELTHGFDNQGRLFDKYGNIYDWWSESSTKAFDERTQCLVNQYSGFTYPGYGLSVNGSLTLPENIADNGGIKESYMAYQTWTARNGEEPAMPGFEHMTNNQMFFLAWGQLWCDLSTEANLRYNLKTDVHSPGGFRVIGPLQNSKSFADTYNCPSGSYMNPVNKCRVW